RRHPHAMHRDHPAPPQPSTPTPNVHHCGGRRLRTRLAVVVDHRGPATTARQRGGVRVTEFEAAVLAAVRAVPVGGVATYGEIAEEAGRPGAARAVGNVLKHADDPTLPWWRIIRADGTVPKGAEQAR